MNRRPRRGEVYWVNFEPARGVEQRGRRPALVVQNNRGNEHSDATVVAAVSSAPLARTYPFIVKLDAGTANLPRASHVNCSQIMTVDRHRLEARIGELPDEVMQLIDAALRYEFSI